MPYYTTTGSDEWDGESDCQWAWGLAGDSGNTCVSFGNCILDETWCQIPTSGWNATPIKEYSTSSTDYCAYTPNGTCNLSSKCEMVDGPRQIWPESGSNLWAHSGNSLFENEVFVFETVLEDVTSSWFTAGPTYEVQFSYDRNSWSMPEETISCTYNGDTNFTDLVACVNTTWEPNPPSSLYVYWRAVQRYNYGGGDANLPSSGSSVVTSWDYWQFTSLFTSSDLGGLVATNLVSILSEADTDYMQVPLSACSNCNRYYGLGASAGRFDADLEVDLITSTNANGSANPSAMQGGTAYVLYDVASTTGSSEFELESGADIVLRSESSGDQFGRYSTVVGDIDGDGLEDIVATADTQASGNGAVYVITATVMAGWSSSVDYSDAIIVTGEAAETRWFGSGVGSYLSPSPTGFINLSSY